MRIQVGSKVKFLNDVGGGIVRGFKDDKMAIVETDDGFEMPVLVTDLLPDASSIYDAEESARQSSQNKQPAKTETPVVSFEEQRFRKFTGEAFLAIVPQNDQILHVSNFDLYLVNDSNYSLHYHVSQKDSNVFSTIAHGTIEPDTKEVVKEFTQTEVSKIQSLSIQGIFLKEGLFERTKPLDKQHSVEGVSFYKSGNFSENDYFHEKAILLKDIEPGAKEMNEAIEGLKKSDIAKVIESKEKKAEDINLNSPKNDNLEEVDLHIEAIVETTEGLSNGEIVNIQMARFETSLETALLSKLQRIVFIHGVGNGRLKHELRKKLDRKYPDLRYQDASFKEYGYGATMVYLK